MRRRMLSAETFQKQRTNATPVRATCLSERSKQKALPSRARRAEGLVILALFLTLAPAPLARAEYAVLRNGQRLHITGYEHLATAYRLQMAGPRCRGSEPAGAAPPRVRALGRRVPSAGGRRGGRCRRRGRGRIRGGRILPCPSAPGREPERAVRRADPRSGLKARC